MCAHRSHSNERVASDSRYKRTERAERKLLDLSRYQWAVLLTAWLGWGFSGFVALLFNYVASNCVPTLLGLTLNSPAAYSATVKWTGLLTSLFLIGWAVGGILFGKLADRFGRVRIFALTVMLYSISTALCALAPNIWILLACRTVASLGVGGEWAAGATMVAEVMPEKRRVQAGAILNTAVPCGLFFATFVTYTISAVLFKSDPLVSWRYVFLSGSLPALVAIIVWFSLKEPQRWTLNRSVETRKSRVRDLFSSNYRMQTLGGLSLALIALLTWWNCSSFISTVTTGWAQAATKSSGFGLTSALALAEQWKAMATNFFNLGGLLGMFLTALIAQSLSRRKAFAMFFLLSVVTITTTFGLDLEPQTRVYLYFPLGLTVFGIFGIFPFYLPELFPTWIRGTGAGFCYNAGRIIAAMGPFLIGLIASLGHSALATTMKTLFWTASIPALGLIIVPFIVETRDHKLSD